MPRTDPPLPLGIEPLAGAEISEDGCYRYRLWRAWGPGPRLLWIMLNPSTADGEADDPTIRRCCGFARREGLHGIEVVNLYAWRATDPKALVAAREAGEDVIGPRNFAAWDEALGAAQGPIVAAWGASIPRGSTVRLDLAMALRHRQIEPVCLGRTLRGGHPRHPLYVRSSTAFEPFT